MDSGKKEEFDEFDWIQLRKDVGLNEIEKAESFSEKFARKFNENPLVPIGALLTTVFLTLGLRTLKTGDSRMSQLMMRGRVLAQGFTVAALVTGICLKASSSANSDK